VVDLGDVVGLDSINVGTLAAACTLGDDHRVAVFLDNSTAAVAAALTAAGIPRQCIRSWLWRRLSWWR
jgi:hypothetical protein